MRAVETNIETMRDELINYYMNLSHKHDEQAHSAENVYVMNIHMGVANQMRNKASVMLIRKDDYIIKLYNDVFNNNKD